MSAPCTTRPLGRLALRVYAFAIVTVVLAIVLMFGTIRFLKGPHWMQGQGEATQALARQLGERYRDPDALVRGLDDATRGMSSRHALYARGGARLWPADGDDLPSAPSAREWRALDGGGAVIGDDRIVVGVPGHPDLAFIDNPVKEFPGLAFAVALAFTLLAILLSSVWFSRGIVRPLRRLEAAAVEFGAGDPTVRAGVDGPGELGAVGRAFDGMAERIEQLLRMQRELLADVSHELRTPLARIRVAIELATEDPDAARDVLGEVGIDLGEIEQIIDDLLTVVRLDPAGAGAGLPQGAVAIDELVRRARERFTSMHPRRALEVAADGGAVVHGHGPLLRRALDNLLDNAAKYSPDDVPIVLRARAADDAVVLEVIDRGVGMSADELAHAFTPFWRADESRSRGTGGVGLGLALARRVARAHGGDVTLRSAPGDGTTAALSIPRGA